MFNRNYSACDGTFLRASYARRTSGSYKSEAFTISLAKIHSWYRYVTVRNPGNSLAIIASPAILLFDGNVCCTFVEVCFFLREYSRRCVDDIRSRKEHALVRITMRS